jgi:hypothetical protein
MDLERRLDLGGRALGLPAVSARNLDSRRLGQRTSWLVSLTGTLAVSYFLQIDFCTRD